MHRIFYIFILLSFMANAEPTRGIPVQLESITYETEDKKGSWYTTNEMPYADTCSKNFSYLQGFMGSLQLDYKTNLDKYKIKDNTYTHSYYPIEGQKIITIKPCQSYIDFYGLNKGNSFDIQRRVETRLFLSLEGPSIDIGGGSRITEWESLEKVGDYIFKDKSLVENTNIFDISEEEVSRRASKRYPSKEQWAYVSQFVKGCPDSKTSGCYTAVSNVEYRVMISINYVNIILVSFSGSPPTGD